MIESIEISNLRGIKSGRLEGLTPLVVLVGPNGCGKSTVLDALLIGAAPLPAEAIGQVVERRSYGGRHPRWLFYRSHEGQVIGIKVRSLRGSGRGTSIVRRLAGPDEKAVLQCHTPNEHGAAHDFSIAFKKDGYEAQSREEAYRVAADVQLVHSPGVTSTPLHELYSRAVEQGRRDQAIAIVKEVIPDARDLLILTEDNSPLMHVEFSAGYSVPIALAGDGIHALAHLALELAAQPDGLVLVEEPELHEHPRGIAQTAKAIRAAVDRDVQVVLTTHSLELIDMLIGDATKDDLEKISLFRLKLADAELLSTRVAGPDVAFARQQIEDDLR